MNKSSPQEIFKGPEEAKYLKITSVLWWGLVLLDLNIVFSNVVIQSYLAYVIDPDKHFPLFLLLTVVTDGFKVWLTRELWVRGICSHTSFCG